MEFVLLMFGIFVCSILIVLILRLVRIHQNERYTDRFHDYVYDERMDPPKKRG